MSLPIRFLTGLTTGAGVGSNRARGTAEGRYAVEFDGIENMRASKISGLGEEHTPVRIPLGNSTRQEQVRGNTDADEFSFTLASGIHDTAIRQLWQWQRDYDAGIDASPRSGRVVVFDETGATPVETWELIDCVPRSIKGDDRTAEGTGGAMVTVMVKPYQVNLI